MNYNKWDRRDRKRRAKRNFTPDNRRSVRNIIQIIIKKAEKALADKEVVEPEVEEAPDIKQQDLDTRVNTELTNDESAQVYLDDIRNSKDTTKPLAMVNKIKTNSINGFKKAAKELQGYIDENYGSENDQVSENVDQAQQAIDGMEIILQGRNLDFDDNFNIVDLGADEVAPAVEAPAEAGLLPQLEQSLVRRYGKNYENNPAFQEYLDENDLVDIRELDEEGQQDLHSDLSVRDIDTGFAAGFLGVTPQNLKLLGDTIIGAGRFTFQTLPKFIQKQGKNLGVTSDNFKQKWDEYSADPGKAPQKLKSYMKKVFTHMKKWYGKGKDAVVEYLKNPKIGLGIQDVSETGQMVWEGIEEARRQGKLGGMRVKDIIGEEDIAPESIIVKTDEYVAKHGQGTYRKRWKAEELEPPVERVDRLRREAELSYQEREALKKEGSWLPGRKRHV